MQVQGFLKTTDCQIAGTVENIENLLLIITWLGKNEKKKKPTEKAEVDLSVNDVMSLYCSRQMERQTNRQGTARLVNQVYVKDPLPQAEGHPTLHSYDGETCWVKEAP